MLPPQSMVTIKNRSAGVSSTGFGDGLPGVQICSFVRRCFGYNSGRVFSTPGALLVFVMISSGCMPAGPRALLDGTRMIEQGKYTQAVDQLKTAISLLPTNAQAWNYFGLACHYAGQAEEAEKAYQRALALDHNLFETHFNLGCLLLTQNKTNLARNELTAFNLRRPKSVEGLLKLSLAQLRCRELAGAEKGYNDVLKLNSHSAEALNGLGLTRVARNHGADAAVFFHRALKEQPSYRPALLNLAIVSHQYLKNRQFALEKYRE